MLGLDNFETITKEIRGNGNMVHAENATNLMDFMDIKETVLQWVDTSRTLINRNARQPFLAM